jgi:hypothetical protein
VRSATGTFVATGNENEESTMKKTKTFITVMPFELRERLVLTRYAPVGCDELEYGETRFPIIPVIAHHAKGEESVRIIVVQTDGEGNDYNFVNHFLPEVKELCGKMGVQYDLVTVRTPNSESAEDHLRLFADIVEVIHDNEELYACMTYGTKPTPVVISLALSFAHRFISGTKVGRIVYGKYFHNEDRPGCLYDTTSLFYMDSIVNRLAEMRASDPRKAVRLLLGLEIVEDLPHV